MSFEIHVDEQCYTLEEFIIADLKQGYLAAAQSFLSNWVSGKAFIFRSSGSTGVPKELVFERWQLELSAKATINALHLGNKGEHILLCINAQFVGGAMMIARALILDCPITIMEPVAKIMGRLSSEHPYTFVSFVPIQIADMGINLSIYNRFTNVLIGGGPLGNEMEAMLGTLAARSFQTYGMTETLSHVALKNLKSDIGYKVLEPYSIRINEKNQICIMAPFLDHELITSDLGRWVKFDQFEWFGRADFVINSGGVKIHPEEIEEKIIGTGILNVRCEIILGSKPHNKLGSELVLISNVHFPQEKFEELQNKLKEMGLKYEVPKRFLYLEQFPRLESGKISRLKINEWLVNQ